MIKLYLDNKSKADADIHLYEGGRVAIRPLSSVPINEEYSAKSARYYAQLRPLGIFLRVEDVIETPLIPVDEVPDSTEEDLRPLHPVTEPEGIEEDLVLEESEVDPELEQEGLEDEGTDLVESSDSEVLDSSDELKEEKEKPILELSKLMQKKQAELISMAKELGHGEVNTSFSKKQLCSLILGDADGH